MRCARLVASIILGSLIGPLPSNSSALAGQITTNFTSLVIAAADLLFWSEGLEPYREGPRGCPDSVDSAQVGFAKAVDWYWTDSIDATARTYFDRHGDPVMVNLNLNSISYRDSTGHWVVPSREDFPSTSLSRTKPYTSPASKTTTTRCSLIWPAVSES